MFQSLRAFFSSPVVICKGDSNASIRVWEKLMKPGELHDVSSIDSLMTTDRHAIQIE